MQQVVDQRWLSAKEVSEYLKDRGLPLSVATLDSFVSKGGGPRYVKFGRKARRYQPSWIEEWIAARMGASRTNSSQPTTETAAE